MILEYTACVKDIHGSKFRLLLVFIRYIATAKMCKKIKAQSGKNNQ